MDTLAFHCRHVARVVEIQVMGRRQASHCPLNERGNPGISCDPWNIGLRVFQPADSRREKWIQINLHGQIQTEGKTGGFTCGFYAWRGEEDKGFFWR